MCVCVCVCVRVCVCVCVCVVFMACPLCRADNMMESGANDEWVENVCVCVCGVYGVSAVSR